MQEWLINKKLIAIIAIVLAVLVFTVFFGSRLAFSYYFNQGLGEFQKGNWDKAGLLFDKSLKFSFRNPEPHFYLGKIALGKPALGKDILYPDANYSVAVNRFEKALTFGLSKKNRDLYPTALNDTGFSYWMMKNKDKADEKFLKLLEISPEKSFTARYFLASDYFGRLNKPKEALDILLPAPDMAVLDIGKINLFKVHALLALLNLYFEDYNNVKKYAELAIESAEPQIKSWEIQTAHALLAVNYGLQKKFTLAESEIKKANDLAGSAGANDCFLGAAYAAGKNYSKAISVAESSNKTADDYTNSVCLRVLAISYLAKGDKVKTKKYMEEYLTFTEKLAEKNIFVTRNRQQFADELLKLK